MPKNIILCSDGTGNSDVKGRGTNVFKLFEAVDLNEHRTDPTLDAQLAFYDDGVGTEGNALVKAIGGAAGYGLARNVKKLYRELSRVYDPGDRIFLFGFSRGAFTVRTLAGMIGVCGVLKGESISTARRLEEAVEAAYDTYRAGYWSRLTTLVGTVLRWPDRQAALTAFRRTYEPHESVPIKFLGVWDTVDAVGMPFALADFVNTWIQQFKFPTQSLGRHVEHACHALSLDDDRLAFEPVLWSAAPDDHRIEQVWFAGVHSNVGGGYPKQGMSLVALDWMLCHAAEYGLRLQPTDHALFRSHASVDDMLYDPRAGLGIFYRWAPRDVRKYCMLSGVTPRLHLTVGERIAHGTADYAPGNLPPDIDVAITPPDPREPNAAEKTQLLQQRAEALQQVMRSALQSQGYLLDRAKGDLFVGDISYWMFMLGWVCFLVAGGLAGARLRWHVSWGWSGGLAALAVADFFIAWCLAGWIDGHTSDRFSEFWHKHRPALRASLKHTHAAAREGLRGTRLADPPVASAAVGGLPGDPTTPPLRQLGRP